MVIWLEYELFAIGWLQLASRSSQCMVNKERFRVNRKACTWRKTSTEFYRLGTPWSSSQANSRENMVSSLRYTQVYVWTYLSKLVGHQPNKPKTLLWCTHAHRPTPALWSLNSLYACISKGRLQRTPNHRNVLQVNGKLLGGYEIRRKNMTFLLNVFVTWKFQALYLFFRDKKT